LTKKYEEWEIYNTQTLTLCKDVHIDPIESKLFSNDVFSIDDNHKPFIQHSSVRVGQPHPGVLHIINNKTYGRHGKRLLYKCVPDDIRLPSFLIPYEMKHIGFSKVFVNLYVTFSFVSWEDKHPIGMLSQVIGPVDVLDNFYEYQLYCKSLNASIQKFNKDTTNAIKSKTQEDFISIIKDKYPSIDNRCETHDVFSIDPYHCVDFDDAFSIQPDSDSEDIIISVYIANVPIWLEILDLWDSFSRRISTIYLPDKKRPMMISIKLKRKHTIYNRYINKIVLCNYVFLA
jgi:exoribonuclease R